MEKRHIKLLDTDRTELDVILLNRSLTVNDSQKSRITLGIRFRANF